MQPDQPPRQVDSSTDRLASASRRREILKRFGKTSLIAGVASSPLAAMATGSSKKWCKHPLDQTKCVAASISGVGSVVLSAQASSEVCSKKCSHYSSTTNWPSNCSNGSAPIDCNTKFCDAFGCTAWNAQDSNGIQRRPSAGAAQNPDCLLNKKLITLCTSFASSPEAAWCTGLANANKLANPSTGAPFPYTPGEVVGHFSSTDFTFRAAALTFYRDYAQTYP